MSQTLEKGYIDKKEKGSGEYQDLYLEGIELLQKLSGGYWTDYNEHDPGVTIFENLAYTLSSLSYKVDMPMRDILYESKQKELVSGDNGFFIASEILTTNPVVKEDYRKVMVDGIKNVKNVWINTLNQDREKESTGNLNLRGLYRVFVEMYEYDSDPAKLKSEEERVKKEVRDLYHAQRNLCEDLYDVTVLQPHKLEMELHLTLDMEADGESVFGQVYYNINDFLTHEAKFESLWELQRQKVEFNSIHTGPTLDNGFMRDKELREQIRNIYIADLTKIISKVPGVVSIDKFRVNGPEKDKLTEDESSGKSDHPSKIIEVPSNATPRFELPNQKQANQNLVFKTADISLTPNARDIKKRYVGIEAEHYGNFKTVSQSLNKVEIPKGETLGISSYYSVREQFPVIYGVGRYGLPRSASRKREAQARQLKAYLLPFDQLMANFLSQLNNVYTLYDTRQSEKQTYFFQVLDDMTKLHEKDGLIKNVDSGDTDPIPMWKATLAQLNRDFDTDAIDRLNQVTDTLLARFAEGFPTYVLEKINISCFGKQYNDDDFDNKLLKWKQKLISNYGYLSYNRSRSFNYLNNEANYAAPAVSFTLPVIIEKIAILLGVKHPELRNLSKIMKHTEYSAEVIIDAKPEDYERSDFQVFEKLYKTMRGLSLQKEHDDSNLNTLFKQGVIGDNYQVIDKSESKDQSELKLNDPNALTLLRDRSISKVRKAKRHAVKLMKKLNEKTEGIHLLEHILLAPPATEDYYGFSFYIITKYWENDTFEATKFEHTSLKSSSERNKDLDIVQGAMRSGTLLEYRKKKPSKGDSYKIEIFLDKQGPLAISEFDFSSEAAVDNAIKDLKDLHSRKESYSMHYKKHFAYLNDTKVDESFFSFRMSFILPAWPVRFQQDSFRIQFNNILYQQVPIHIHYNTHWLGLNKMSKFEEAYFEWLTLLQDDLKIEERIKYAEVLFNIIKGFENSGDGL